MRESDIDAITSRFEGAIRTLITLRSKDGKLHLMIVRKEVSATLCNLNRDLDAVRIQGNDWVRHPDRCATCAERVGKLIAKAAEAEGFDVDVIP